MIGRMLIEDRCTYCDSPQPRSFAALMEMYEANYIRLRRLCPDLSSIADETVSRVSGTLDLHLSILERTPYTTTVLLTYHFDGDCAGKRPNPNLIIRVYHDARQAEVLSRSCRREHRDVTVNSLPMDSALLCKWRLNRFLYKWLGYCQRQGHQFPTGISDERRISSAGDPATID